ncbi:SAV_2336 N-terminal domain-related protein [Streptomyces sp. NPDC055089]
MADALDPLIRALASAMGDDADATAIADALWLAAASAASAGAPSGGPAARAESGAEATPPDPPPVPGPDAAVPPRPAEDAETRVLYESLPQSTTAPGVPVTMPGGRDLPRAMELRRALRPFMRRYPRGRRSTLDLGATLRGYRRTGELTPVFSPAPEPWFELLLVVDTSASMAVWKNTNAEFAGLLAGLGAFRRVRTWSVRPGPAPVVTDHQGRPVAPGQTGAADGRRLVLVLSDCVAPGWRHPEIWKLLRRWGAKGPVALLNPLPGRLWHRTGLDLPAVRAGQARPGLKNSDLSFRVPLLVRTLPGAGSADWQALPTLTFSPHSLARWAETFMRGAPHGYDAVLIPRSGTVSSRFPTPSAGLPPGTDPAELFLRTASRPALRLAALCSPFGRLSLPLLHLIRQQLLPEAGVGDLAELLTSPVVNLRSTGDAPLAVSFDPALRKRLAPRLSRRDAWLTYDVLSRHIATRSADGRTDIQAVAASGPDSVPPSLYPFARASEDLLALLRSGPPVRATPLPDIPREESAPSRAPTPGGRLPDPARSTAVLIGVSHAGNGGDVPGVHVDLATMRGFLTSPEGWNLPPERCVSLIDPRSAAAVLEAVERALDAADTVLLYYAGHAAADRSGQAVWLINDDRVGGTVHLEFSLVTRLIDSARARHIMVVLDHCEGGAVSRALESTARGRKATRTESGLEVLFVDQARDTSRGGPLTQELLRVSREGVPDGPEFLDLTAITRHMRVPESKRRTGESRPRSLLINEGSTPPAFARNAAWEPPSARTGSEEAETVTTDPVQAVYRSVRERLRSALPRTYRDAFGRDADRLLLALIEFANGFLEGTESADTERGLADAAQAFLAGRGISADREVPGGGRRGDLVWPSESATFAVRVHAPGQGPPAVSGTDGLLHFELDLDPETPSTTHRLTDLVRVVAPALGDGERPCVVALRLPPRQGPTPGTVAPPDAAERHAPAPYADEGEGGFTRNILPRAVESACQELLGEVVADPSTEEDGWTLHGVELPPGLTDLTIQDVGPDTASIVWDTVEEYEYGLVLGQVTVDAHLILEGLMHDSDYSLATPTVRLLNQVNDHMVEVAVDADAQLVFDARREGEQVELEFRGTTSPEPHPHDPM